MKIIGIGDSIMAYNGASTYPQTGWLQMLDRFLKRELDIKVVDEAQNGRSTKSFMDEGLFIKAMDKCENGDIVIISFGHNDEKNDEARHTDPYTSYQSNLKYMISEVRKKGAIPVLVTSWPRLVKDEEGKIYSNHGEYPEAMKKAAEEENVFIVDLLQEGLNLLNKLGYEEAKRLYMIFGENQFENYPEGRNDTSHLQGFGAYQISKIVAQKMKENEFFNSLFN